MDIRSNDSPSFSYWEIKSWLTHVDYAIVGSGIVGLNCALALKEKYPKSKVLVLEKGILPQGASTKNAGFACFGSLSELLDDLQHHTEQEVIHLVQKRWKGLQLLRKTLGDKTIDYREHGGYELFLKKDNLLFEECTAKKNDLNQLLAPVFNAPVFDFVENPFGFLGIKNKMALNKFEAQLDTGKMMDALLQKVQSQGVKILNGVGVEELEENAGGVTLKTNLFTLEAKKVLIATNGFASQLIDENVQPARAQVVITKPIPNLKIKGTFHLDRGYYYFRNIDDRILLGGGRNLDFVGETTSELGLSKQIQHKLEEVLANTILPDTPFEIEHRWSGIMGVGNQKKAIVKQTSNHVYCGVRLGGMGIAIGSLIGKELAECCFE